LKEFLLDKIYQLNLKIGCHWS